MQHLKSGEFIHVAIKLLYWLGISIRHMPRVIALHFTVSKAFSKSILIKTMRFLDRELKIIMFHFLSNLYAVVDAPAYDKRKLLKVNEVGEERLKLIGQNFCENFVVDIT